MNMVNGELTPKTGIGWQKILAVVAGLVVLVGIAYLVLWLKPETEPSGIKPTVQNGTSTVGGDVSGWKTYRNEKYGYEFRYPSELEIVEGENSVILKWAPTQGMAPFLGVFIETNPLHLAINDYYDGDPGRNLALKDTPFQPITVSGAQAFRGSPLASFAGEVTIVIPFSGNFLRITDEGGSFKENGVFDQILSTFKFIEPEVDTSGWKSYRSAEYGFEFEYPQEWKVSGRLSDPPVLELDNFNGQYEHGGIIPFGGASLTIFFELSNKSLDYLVSNIIGKEKYDFLVDKVVGGERGKEFALTVDLVDYKEKFIYALVGHEDLIYRFSMDYYPDDPKALDYSIIFDKVLASFKFLQ